MTRSAPNASAWSCGRWPAIRMATSAPPKLAAVAIARWTETSAVEVGPPALPSGIPCMRSSATTAASQYPITAMKAPVTTPPTLLKANGSRVVKRAVYRPRSPKRAALSNEVPRDTQASRNSRLLGCTVTAAPKEVGTGDKGRK